MAFDRDDIERVRAGTDLVDLVAEVTKVKRSGRNVMAVCPFHQEKTPSMSVDRARGLYHCFGCGKSGDVFRFVQETQGLDFADSVELLARRVGVTLRRDPEAAKRRSRRQAMVDAVEAAIAFYHDRLRNAPDAAGARSYLRGRGYDVDIVERYALGYSPPDGQALTTHLRDSGVNQNIAQEAGLLMSRSGRVFDRFRGRLMFPIRDLRGDAVGFGARLLEGDGPKYLNSPESPVYHKARLLYGLDQAKSEIVRRGVAVVVEGYTDVIALDQAGMAVGVATCGTALGEDHLDLLRRFSERVVLMFDADEAGVGASLRGFERSVPGDLDLRVATLPSGADPADVVSTGDIEAISKSVESSVPLLQFTIEQELARFDLDEAEARARAVKAATELVARHPDPVVRHEYGLLVARRTGVDREVVLGAVQRHVARYANPQSGVRRAPAEQITGEGKAEVEILRLLAANDEKVRALEVDRGVFSSDLHVAAYDLIQSVIEALAPGVAPDLGRVVDDRPEAQLVAKLALDDRPTEPDPAQLLRKIRDANLGRRIEDLNRHLASLDTEGQGYSDALRELIALERERKALWSET